MKEVTGNGLEVEIPGKDFTLHGILTVPENAGCVVIFAHGSGSSRHSVRNQFVSRFLNKNGLATLLFDLLTPDEAEDRSNVFDIEFLSSRLHQATVWISRRPEVSGLPLGYFGASTGAAAALRASMMNKVKVGAIVSRGGRPDLAWEILDRVEAPTLLIVGSSDYGVVELNESSYNKLKCRKRMELVPEATHLFEEPGTLEKVAELAKSWFLSNLVLKESAEI